MTTTGSSSKKRTKRIPFPQRLFNLLKLAEENGWEDIISWVDEGKRVKVHDKKKFETLLLAKYFKTPRYPSFARQLHAYGFDCIRTGRGTGIYSHPGFTRDNPEGSCSLQRESSSVSQTRNQLPVASLQLGIRAGDTIVQFPSFLKPSSMQDDESAVASTSDSGTTQSSRTGIAGLHNTVHSQVADQTRRALIRIPPQAPDNPFNNPDNAFWLLSASRFQTIKNGEISPAAVVAPTQQQQDHYLSRTIQLPDVSKVDGMNIMGYDASDPVPLAAEEDDGDDDDILQFGDLEPKRFSPEHSLPDGDDDDDGGRAISMDHPNQPLLMDGHHSRATSDRKHD